MYLAIKKKTIHVKEKILKFMFCKFLCLHRLDCLHDCSNETFRLGFNCHRQSSPIFKRDSRHVSLCSHYLLLYSSIWTTMGSETDPSRSIYISIPKLMKNAKQTHQTDWHSYYKGHLKKNIQLLHQMLICFTGTLYPSEPREIIR